MGPILLSRSLSFFGGGVSGPSLGPITQPRPFFVEENYKLDEEEEQKIESLSFHVPSL